VSVTDVEGDAAVGMSRGKKRYIYDMSVTLSWQVSPHRQPHSRG
jgi:hypothetical protein